MTGTHTEREDAAADSTPDTQSLWLQAAVRDHVRGAAQAGVCKFWIILTRQSHKRQFPQSRPGGWNHLSTANTVEVRLRERDVEGEEEGRWAEEGKEETQDGDRRVAGPPARHFSQDTPSPRAGRCSRGPVRAPLQAPGFLPSGGTQLSFLKPTLDGVRLSQEWDPEETQRPSKRFSQQKSACAFCRLGKI